MPAHVTGVTRSFLVQGSTPVSTLDWRRIAVETRLGIEMDQSPAAKPPQLFLLTTDRDGSLEDVRQPLPGPRFKWSVAHASILLTP